jgi:tRNA dimethylallyltransferase
MRPRLVCLVGPTASGKTRLALELAPRLDAEIICADSRQVYRGLDLGTAKPTPAERAQVPHHGLDLAEPDDAFDVARFREAALAAIATAHARRKSVLVVGGTGLYVRALLAGLCPAPPRSPRLRAVLRDWAEEVGTPALHRRLGHVDAAAAARIHPHDLVRVVRALEVATLTGRRLSEWQASHGFAEATFDALVVGLAVPTPVLAARIATRVDAMLAAGWLDEVRGLVARCLPDDAPVWRTLGYGHLRAVVEGRSTLAAARDATVLATRRYAKRQRTWFRHDATVVWRDPEVEGARILADATAFLHAPHIAKAGSPE